MVYTCTSALAAGATIPLEGVWFGNENTMASGGAFNLLFQAPGGLSASYSFPYGAAGGGAEASADSFGRSATRSRSRLR